MPSTITSTRRSRLVAAVAAAGLLAGLGVTQALPAQATPHAPRTQPVAFGRVTHIADGDTLDVDITGDGTRKAARIRFNGVQAMELKHYAPTPAGVRGECWAPEAARYLYAITFHRKVRLLSQKGRATQGRVGMRLHRTLEVFRAGTWQDVQGLMLDAGLVLAEASQHEWLHNRDYRARAQAAALAGRGFWGNPVKCGVGPSQEQPLSVSIRYDADGDDRVNLNGEWIDIVNGGTLPVPLGGWWLRDSSNLGYQAHGYDIPAGVSVEPGSRVRVHIGSGTNDATNLYLNRSRPLYANPSGAPKWLGDGAFLFDPQGDLRAYQMYPCEVGC
jgi:micrococcal nuclease